MYNGIEQAFYESTAPPLLLDFITRREKQYQEKYVPVNRFLPDKFYEVTYLSFVDTYETIQRIYSALQAKNEISCFMYQDVYHSNTWGLDVHSCDAPKANGVRFLKELYGYQQVICFGDEVNDLSMFELADIRVAVGNAKKELKAMADDICDTNVRDGVVNSSCNILYFSCR